MPDVGRGSSRAAEAARRARHAQRGPLPTRALGNPAAEIIKAEYERVRSGVRSPRAPRGRTAPEEGS